MINRLLLILFGSFFIGIGFLGIFIPGLPTTPFLLLAAGCYAKSSDRLYTWLINHKMFGANIKNFRNNRSVSLRSKITSLIAMWLMINLSIFLFIKIFWVKILMVILGVIGTGVILLIRTSKNN